MPDLPVQVEMAKMAGHLERIEQKLDLHIAEDRALARHMELIKTDHETRMRKVETLTGTHRYVAIVLFNLLTLGIAGWALLN